MRVWAVVCFSILIVGCASPEAEYLASVVGYATQGPVRKEIGSSKEERSLASGESIWLYRYTGTTIFGPGKWCHAYELRFDAQKVLRQWNDVYC